MRKLSERTEGGDSNVYFLWPYLTEYLCVYTQAAADTQGQKDQSTDKRDTSKQQTVLCPAVFLLH